MPGDVRFSILVSGWSPLGRHKKFVSEIFIKEHPAMKTILAIDLGKSKSVFCIMDTIELTPHFSTLATSPQKFHDVFAELDQQNSIVLFEVGAQSGWLSDMLRLLGIGIIR